MISAPDNEALAADDRAARRVRDDGRERNECEADARGCHPRDLGALRRRHESEGGKHADAGTDDAANRRMLGL